MRYILFCISFLLAIPISGFAQSGLVWKKQLHPSEVLSVTGTDWGYGVSVANDTVKIWSMKDGNVLREVFRKGVFAATVDSTLQHIVYGEYDGGYFSTGYLKVLKLDSDSVVKSVQLREHDGDLWYGKDYKYMSIIDRTGLPLMIGTQIFITKGQSNWQYGRITSAYYTAKNDNSIEFNDIQTYTPVRLRFTDNGKYTYGRFDYSKTMYHYPNTYIDEDRKVYEIYTLPTLKAQQGKNIIKNYDKFSFPLLQSKDGQLLFSKNSIYNSNNLQEIRSGCVPENIREVETIIDENHLLCLPKGTGAALGIWNIVEKRWEYEFEGSEQIKLAVTSDEKYAFTTDNAGYVSMWRLPDNLKNDSIDIRFEMSKRKLYVGDTVSLVNKTFPYANSNSYEWNFGDGTNETSIDVKKVYSEAQKYTITLTVTLKNGAKYNKQEEIEVSARPEHVKVSIFHGMKGKIQSIDISSDNNSLIYCGERDTVRLFNVVNNELKTISSAPNPFYSSFSNNDDSLIVLCRSDTVIPPYTYVKRPLIKYCTGLKNTSLLSVKHSFVHNEEHYINEYSKWPMYSPNLIHRHFKIGMSAQRDWMAICSDANYKYNMTTEVPNAFNLRGTVTAVNDKSVLTADDRYQINTEKCVSETRSPIRSVSVSPDNATYVVATGRFFDLVSENCKESTPHIQIVEKSTKKIIKKTNDNAYCVRYSPDNYHLVSTSGIWDIDSNKIIHHITTPFNTEFEILPDGDNIVLPYKNEEGAIAGIYSIRENKWKTFFYGSPSLGLIDVTALSISDDGKYVATGSSTGAVALWQIPDSLKPKPHAEFRIMKYKATVGEPIRFYNTSIPVQNNFTYTWYFGDGTTSTEKNPTHVYENKGIYSTRLVMKDSVGNEYSYRHNTYVEIEIPSGFREENNKTILSVYPNPCDEKVMVEVVEYPCELSISDMNGAIVYKSFVESETLSIESKTFPTGIYTVRTKVGDSIKSAHCLIIH